MQFYKTTNVPNELFDFHLPYLNQAQLKVLLVVLRQTVGWIDPKTKQRKVKDWITISFFSKKAGLSRKSISYAIQDLVDKELIVVVTKYSNKELRTAKDRRGKKKLYYAYAPYFRFWLHKRSVKKLRDLFTFRP